MAQLNVKTGYGAIGNGTTDDTSAVQAALAAAVAGDTVLFPAGTYLVDTLVPTVGINSLTLNGAGVGSTVIKKRTASSTNGPIIQFNGSSYITVSNLAVNGQNTGQSWWNANPYTADYRNPANSATWVKADNIRFIGGSHNSVTNVTTQNAGAAGVCWTSSSYGTSTNVIGGGNGFGTVVVYGVYDGSNNPTPGVHSDYFTATNSSSGFDYCDAIRICASDYATLTACTFHDAIYNAALPDQFAGFCLQGGTGHVVKNCTSYNNGGRGIDCDDGSATPGYAVTNTTITGCTVYANRTNGILLGASGLNVSGNLVYDNLTGGIDVRGANQTVTYNVCHAVNKIQAYGIGLFAISTATNCTVSYNDVRANSTIGITTALTSSAGFVGTGNVSTVSNAIDQPYNFVNAAMVGATDAIELSAYTPRVSDKNAVFTKVGTSANKLASAQGQAFYIAGTTATTATPLYIASALIPTEVFTFGPLKLYVSGTSNNEVYYWIFGYVDASNYCQIVAVVSTLTITLFLQKVVAGSATTIGTNTVTATGAAVNTVAMNSMAGSLATVLFNGSAVASITNVSTAGLTFAGKKVGVSAYITDASPGTSSFAGLTGSSAVPDVPLAPSYSLLGSSGTIYVTLPGGTITNATITLTPSAGVSLNGGTAGATTTVTVPYGTSTVAVTTSGAGTVIGTNNGGLIDSLPLALASLPSGGGGGKSGIGLGVGLA